MGSITKCSRWPCKMVESDAHPPCHSGPSLHRDEAPHRLRLCRHQLCSDFASTALRCWSAESSIVPIADWHDRGKHFDHLGATKAERIRAGRNMRAQRQDSPIDWPDNQLMIEHSCQRFCPRSSSLHFAESKNAIQIQCFKTTNAIDPILQDTFEMGPNSISSELVTNIVCHGWRKYVLKQKGFNEEPDQNYYKKHESCQFSFSIEIVIL